MQNDVLENEATKTVEKKIVPSLLFQGYASTIGGISGDLSTSISLLFDQEYRKQHTGFEKKYICEISPAKSSYMEKKGLGDRIHPLHL